MPSLAQILAPNEREYFDLFESAGANIVRAAGLTRSHEHREAGRRRASALYGGLAAIALAGCALAAARGIAAMIANKAGSRRPAAIAQVELPSAVASEHGRREDRRDVSLSPRLDIWCQTLARGQYRTGNRMEANHHASKD